MPRGVDNDLSLSLAKRLSHVQSAASSHVRFLLSSIDVAGFQNLNVVILIT